jgi:hypothetical protein
MLDASNPGVRLVAASWACLILCGACGAMAGSVTVKTAPQLTDALTDPGVTMILLDSDIDFSTEQPRWNSTWKQDMVRASYLPGLASWTVCHAVMPKCRHVQVLTRNLTIRGVVPGTYPFLNFSFWPPPIPGIRCVLHSPMFCVNASAWLY